MEKIVLITVRDCYPFETVVLNDFEILDERNLLYDKCVKPLGVLTEEEEKEQSEKAQERGQDPAFRIKKDSIGKLFRDEKARWTKNNDPTKGHTFEDYKKGIPLLRKNVGSVRFYVVPCTGKMRMADNDNSTLLRQQYTSNCIDLVCSIEKVQRTEVFAIVHSLDTGAKTKASCRVTEDSLQTRSPLSDIVSAGRLYKFHHVVGEKVFDKIVTPVCLGKNDELDITLLDEFFPQVTLDWWQVFSQLNTL